MDDRRKERNKDLIERMKSGEPLNYNTAPSTWWQPRPLVVKDKEAINKFYNQSSLAQGNKIDESKKLPVSVT